MGPVHFFSPSPPDRPFRLFGPDHLAGLAVTGAATAALVASGRRMGPAARRRTQRLLTAALWGQEVTYHAWRARWGTWNVQEMLPLHLCSVLVWGEPVALLRPSRIGDEIVWYWGVTGAPQALLTPDIGAFGFPHFRFVQFFLSHGLVLAIPLWMVGVEGRRPTAPGGVVSLAALAAHAAVVHRINRRLGSNYLFVNRKPATPSVLDALPPYPRYIPVLAALAAGAFALAWVPIGVAQRRRRRP